MAFIKYVKRAPKAGKGEAIKEKTISISPRGVIGLGVAVVELYFRGKKYVELFYEAKKNKLGLKPLTKKTADSFTIRYDKTGRIGQIIARGFFNRFQITIASSTRLSARWVGRAKLLSADLGAGTTSSKGKRKTRKKRVKK